MQIIFSFTYTKVPCNGVIMFNLGHPYHEQGMLKAKFEKAARRTKLDEPRVFKDAHDFATHVLRACNSGVLLHSIVADTIGLGANTKLIHKTLRGIKDSEINRYCRKIMDAHHNDPWRYFERTKEDWPKPVPERVFKPIKLNAR